MITISLCIVAGNDIENLVNTVESVKDIADEIIIINVGNVESTKTACSKYTGHVYDFPQMQDSAAAWNYALSLTSKEYILWLEPGDILLEPDRQKLLRIKMEWDDSSDAIRMPHVIESIEEDKLLIEQKRPRMVKRNKFFQWHSGLDGHLPVRGRLISTDITVSRRVERGSPCAHGLSVYEYKLENGENLTAKELYYYAEKLYERKQYSLAAEYYEKLLKEKDAWIGDKLSACERLADIHREQGVQEKELQYLFESFKYDLPRAEFLCRLGTVFTERKDDRNAAFWYQLALAVEKPKDHLGFYKEECWTWFPNFKLCGCYFRLGDMEKAYFYNEKALEAKPDETAMLSNKKLLEGILKKKEAERKQVPEAERKIPKRPLKIVQVAPDVYPVPPENYGGIESVIFEITEELVKRGHDVYLYAPKGSKTSAKLIPYQHTGMGQFEKIAEFVIKTLPEGTDIIHDHTHISVLGKKNLYIPTVCTIHGTINYRVKHPVFVSRRALEVIGGNHGYYVYNGLKLEEYEYSENKQDYMLYLGRLDKMKGIGHALEVAVRTKKKLVIAGPVHDTGYFVNEVEPILKNNPNIEYIGSVGGRKKQEVIKHARCLLFPTSWEEPFGLVMIEAMACGTPVIAFANGAVPEVLEAFPQCICYNADEMAEKVIKAEFPSPRELRDYVLNRFSTEKMVDGYIEVYEKLAECRENKDAIKKVVPSELPKINISANKTECLKIVQVAPNAFPCPPKDYGGIERVVFDLTEELVKKGNEVYLFAAEGSRSNAKIITYKNKSTDPKEISEFVLNNMPDKVDIIHDHTHAYVMSQCDLNIPIISTIHDSRKNTAKHPVYLCRKALQQVGANNGFYVYNGINLDDYEFSAQKEDYLLFMGLLYAHKGINFALDVAERTGHKLIVAGPIYNLDYYKKEIEPRVNKHPNIQYVGSVGGEERQKLLKHARCMLFPTVWEEPFGLVMIEAMACGTPVLAFGNGAVPEVLGGFPELICSDVNEMTEKVNHQVFPNARLLRNYVNNNFSSARMADNYLGIYRNLIATKMLPS